MRKFKEEARILDQENVALQTWRLRLLAPRIAAEARAGQFIMLQVREGQDPLLRRPLSFHRILPEEGVIEILYRVVGRGTWWLSRCEPGTRLSLLGPLGNGFRLPEKQASSIVVVAGGIGIAPLFELMTQLVAKNACSTPQGIHLFYGARSAAEFLPPQAFHDLEISIHWSTDDGSLGYHGFVTRLVDQIVLGQKLCPEMLYACGPLPMQYNLAKWVLAHGAPSQLSLESLMACGLGACLGCALPAPHPGGSDEDHYVHVCKDGPIFPAGSILWQKIRLYQTAPPLFLYS